MRLHALFREVRRDITSGTTHFALLGFALAVIISALVCADSLMISQQLQAAETFRSSGGATLILEASGRIDGTACDALGKIPGVSAAGALRNSDKVTLSVLPDAPVPEYEVTRGIPQMLSAKRSEQTGLVVPQDLADSLGAQLGDIVDTTQGHAPIAAIYPYPSDGRRQGLGYAILSVTGDQDVFDECWVEAWPQISNLQSMLFATLRAGASDTKDSPKISQLNPSLGSEFSGSEQFLTRITRAAPAVALLAGLLLGYGTVRARRLQIASALHTGVSRQDMIYIQLLQAFAWVLPASVVGVGTAALVAMSTVTSDASSVFGEQPGVPLAALAGTLIGVFAAALSIREKHLFRYFKDR